MKERPINTFELGKQYQLYLKSINVDNLKEGSVVVACNTCKFRNKPEYCSPKLKMKTSFRGWCSYDEDKDK